MSVNPVSSAGRGGPADVIYVLCLLQVAWLLLGALGEVLLMGGNPAYLVLPLAKMALLLVVAAKVVTGRRWAVVTLIVVQSVTLFGFGLQLLAGLLPIVDFTVNLVGLITNLALPVTLIYLCARMLPTVPRKRPKRSKRSNSVAPPALVGAR